MADLEWQTEEYVALDQYDLAQELYDSGMLYYANRNLHLFGFALGVAVREETGEVVGLNIHKTSDPEGIWFDDETELAGRRKFFASIRRGSSK